MSVIAFPNLPLIFFFIHFLTVLPSLNANKLLDCVTLLICTCAEINFFFSNVLSIHAVRNFISLQKDTRNISEMLIVFI